MVVGRKFVLIYSKDEEVHIEHIKMVLQVLKGHKIYDKLRKCNFYQIRIQYLGHVISEDEISIDHEKIEAIVNWPTPKNATCIPSFMGLVGYYQRFIECFSKLANHITLFHRKNVKFNWSEKCERRF